MSAIYDPRWVRRFYDAYGDKEWERLTKGPEDEVKLHVHRYYLDKYVNSGDSVADIGAGAGRFTQILVELGAVVTVIDISQVQLELNRKHAVQYGFEHGVRDRLLLDVCKLAGVESATFDAVVCYGGPLSYVFEQAGQALDEIHRILKPDGIALISVMSLWGTVHRYLDGVLKLPGEVNRPIIRTGDLCPEHYPEGRHHCHMFRAPELREALESHGLAVIEMSASNCVSSVWQERLAEARNTPAQWQQLLEMEIEACREPGCVDMGTHTIAVCRKVPHQ